MPDTTQSEEYINSFRWKDVNKPDNLSTYLSYSS
jgi:hypothetical protein